MISGIIVMLLAVGIGSTSKAGTASVFWPASTEPVVRFEPQSLNVCVGQMFSLTVLVENVSLLYAFDIQITWNTTCLKYIDHTATVPVETYPDGLLHEPVMWFKNVVDENGVSGAEPETRYWISVVSMSGAPSFEGNGSAFTMMFKALNFTGTATLNFTNIQLADVDAQPIPYTSSNCTVEMISYPVHNIDTGLDYATIQEAINAPETSNGHTIFVEEGTYCENVVVNKAVSLIGENESTTMIDGKGSGTALSITSNNVTVSKFTIQNGVNYGIYSNSTGNIIHDNIITSNWPYSIFLYGNGGAWNNTVLRNTVSNSGQGIVAFGGARHRILNNTILNNVEGLTLCNTSCSILRFNNLTNNVYNFGVRGTWVNSFVQDIDTSNIVNGKPIYYLIDLRNIMIDPHTYPDIGYLGVINSINITVEDLTLTNNGEGILFVNITDSSVRNIDVSCNFHGIYLYDVSGNKVWNCRVFDSYYGVFIYGMSGNNTFHHNNFINNTNQVYLFDPHNNTWDNGCEGNYWSNYNGTDLDSDGIGDTYLPWEGHDYYPLTNPYWNSGDVDHDLDVDLYDAVKLLAAYGSEIGDKEFNCHCDINEPYGVINLYDAVLLLVNYGKKYS